MYAAGLPVGAGAERPQCLVGRVASAQASGNGAFIPQRQERDGTYVAVAVTAAALLLRHVLQPWLGPNVPYLQFFPAILIAAWYGGFGPGCLATGLSTVASMYFYLSPAGFARQRCRGHPVADPVRGHRPRHRVAQSSACVRSDRAHASEAEPGHQPRRALAAVINTTVDGIIVINARGIVEEFNRGAERLFGYPVLR